MTTPRSPKAEGSGAERVRQERAESIESALEGLTSALSYCSTRNIEMDNDLVKNLVALRDKYIADGWTTEDEQNFWVPYQDFVSKLETPIDSLIFSKKRTVTVAWILSLSGLFVLGCLVWMLTSWASLDSILSQIQRVEDAYLENTARANELRANSPVDNLTSEGGGPVSDADRKEFAELKVLEGKMETICVQILSQYDLLGDRLKSYSLLLSSGNFDVVPYRDAFDKGESCALHYEKRAADNGYVFGNALILRNSFDSYILPVLFGLLGTIAYILRSLAREIREYRLTFTSLVGAGVRIPLGMLAGLSIGWVAGDQSETVFSQITPWALAFIAGYSVELVFTAMDRLIGAFTEVRPASGAQ